MKQRLLIIAFILIGLSATYVEYKDGLHEGIVSWNIASAQRRTRPGSMKHTDAEVEEVTREKEIKVAAIRNGAVYAGDLYYAVDGRGIQIGTIRLHLYSQTYYFEADLTSHQMREVIRDVFGNEVGTKSTKMGEDFDYKGKYAVLGQAGRRYLRLYGESKDEVFADLDLENAAGTQLKLNHGDALIATLNCTTCK